MACHGAFAKTGDHSQEGRPLCSNAPPRGVNGASRQLRSIPLVPCCPAIERPEAGPAVRRQMVLSTKGSLISGKEPENRVRFGSRKDRAGASRRTPPPAPHNAQPFPSGLPLLADCWRCGSSRAQPARDRQNSDRTRLRRTRTRQRGPRASVPADLWRDEQAEPEISPQ